MKKLFLIIFFSFFLLCNSNAQEVPSGKSMNSFLEVNFGVAYQKDLAFIFPGTSFLWGQNYISKNNFIFEYEVGLAFPSIFTGKFGIGKKFNNTKVVAGIRPFPFNFYLQSSIASRENGYWIVSIEFNPFNNVSFLGEIKAILNFGYRWNIDKKN